MEKKLLILIVALMLAASVHASNYYVTASGSGSRSGADWNNALQGLPADLVRGSTYYLADGTYPGYTFDDAESGSQYIIIKKATIAEHGTGTGWQDSLGDGVVDFTGGIFLDSGYFELNGATGGGPGSWTSGHGIRFQLLSGEAISAYKPLSNVRLLHIEVTQPGEIKKMGGIDAWKNPFKTDYFYIGYCYFHHISGLPIFARDGSNWLFEYNYFSDPCGVSQFDYTQHCEHLVSHDADDVTIRYNIMKDGRSTGMLVNNNLRADRWKVYGNVFQNEGGSAIVSAAADSEDTAYDWWFFNNVFIGPGDLKIIVTTGKAYNNIYLKGPAFPPPGEHDYNYYAEVTFSQCDMQITGHENGNSKYPSDCDSITAPPSPLASISQEDYRLLSPISGWAGMDVCGISACSSENTYGLDWNGKKRGADGVWDRGALEYLSGSCTPSCFGKQCGSDGCGGSCGTCSSGYACSSQGQCTASCNPSCVGKTCGDNGCGGSCGTCASGQSCVANQCTTQSCTTNWICTAWSVCANSLQTRTCSDGNSCGTAIGKPAESQSCSSGALKIGDIVKVTVNPSLRVRSSAGLGDATILGEQPFDMTGTIIAGPVSLDSYTWWQIDYETGVDGWSIEKSGADVYLASAGQCAHVADSDCNGCLSQGELMQYIQQWKSGQATLANLMEAIAQWKKGC